MSSSDTQEFVPVVKAGRPSNDWNWPSRGHKVRPTNGRKPQALKWSAKAGGWVRG